jgi:leucyl aminopeptidase
MSVTFDKLHQIDPAQGLVVVAGAETADALAYCRDQAERDYAQAKLADQADLVVLHRQAHKLFLVAVAHLAKGKGLSGPAQLEKLRRVGHRIAGILREEKIEYLQIVSTPDQPAPLVAVAEGIALSLYSFAKYRSKPEPSPVLHLGLMADGLSQAEVNELANVVKANFVARNLVNEPAAVLTAPQLAREVEQLGAMAGFSVEVLDKGDLVELNMGGLLAVNQGSIHPPVFLVMEHRPPSPVNAQPIVLVGKGVVYDTGGLSLKETPNSMDWMKADMAGAAAVAAALYALALNKLPLHVVGLVPATDNRLSGAAYSPGDVITISDGTTVEVLNTDAEGRLILADALVYARRYDPLLVVDVATLTGSAMLATGKEAGLMMGTADEDIKNLLKNCALAVHERLVEMPLWDEYADYLKSEIADLKNIGVREAGAIQAGKFLEHFTTYPWLHLDIAGTVFGTAPDHYRGKGATGFGARLLYSFLKELAARG